MLYENDDHVDDVRFILFTSPFLRARIEAIEMFVWLLAAVRSAPGDIFTHRNMGYIEVNKTTQIFTSSVAGFTVFVNVQCQNAKVQYRTTISGDYIDINGSVKVGPNTEIKIDATNGFAKVAYVALGDNVCRDELIVSTQHSDTFELSASSSSERCVFFAPATSHLQFNVESAKMDDRWDCLTVYHERVNDVWYDRYETIENPSGWSAISERPWFFKLTTVRYSSNAALATAKIAVRSNDTPIEGENIFRETPPESGYAKHAILQQEIIIPVVGFATPSILLLSWICAFARLARKTPVEALVGGAE